MDCDTFKDLQEDLDEANAEGKRLAIFFEQRGCILHQDARNVYPDPELSDYIDENFFVIQLNLHGDLEVVDFDGDTLTEKQIARKWDSFPQSDFLPEGWKREKQRSNRPLQ